MRDTNPPALDVEKYGSHEDETNRSLVPMTIPDTVSLAHNLSDLDVRVTHLVVHPDVVAGELIWPAQFSVLVMIEFATMQMLCNMSQ